MGIYVGHMGNYQVINKEITTNVNSSNLIQIKYDFFTREPISPIKKQYTSTYTKIIQYLLLYTKTAESCSYLEHSLNGEVIYCIHEYFCQKQIKHVFT